MRWTQHLFPALRENREERGTRLSRAGQKNLVKAWAPGAGIMRAVKHMHFARITIDPRRMGGVPCIRNLRIPVATVVDMVADGMGSTEILQNYPDLDADDIREALQFAAEAVRERELPLLSNG